MNIIISLTFMLLLCDARTVSGYCRTNEHTLSCKYKIPVTVPLVTKEVVIRNLMDPIITQASFAHMSWSSVKTLDLSSNNIAYIGKRAFRGLNSLTTIILSNNTLFQQSRSGQASDSASMLQSLHSLQKVSLNQNMAKFIPKHIFRENYRLEHIDLQDNRLEDASLELNHLKHLKSLNLKKNNIAYLRREAIDEIQQILKPNMIQKNASLALSLEGNPFVCSCNSLKFIHWLVLIVQPLTEVKYTCILDDELVDIDSEALDEAEYMCYRTVWIVSISLVSVVFAGCAIVLAIVTSVFANQLKSAVIKRLMKCIHGNQDRKFINSFIKGHIKEKYLIFLGASSNDFDIVNNTIYPTLDGEMKAMIERRQNSTNRGTGIICSGDETFRLGHYITHETLRCVSLACTAVFVISNSFCRSKYCCSELSAAMNLNKPIILLFIEHIDEEVMSPSLHALFKTTTRAKLVLTKDGRYNLVPGWRNICEDIISHASTRRKRCQTKKRDVVCLYSRTGTELDKTQPLISMEDIAGNYDRT